jgi:hypothetical protein
VSKAIEWAVWRFKRRHAPCVAFDADDARQEALIACWKTGRDDPTVAYSAIVDALRRAIPGYRSGKALHLVDIEEGMEVLTLDTPEEVAIASDTARAIEAGERRPKARVKPAVARDPLASLMEDQARAAAALYREMMHA